MALVFFNQLIKCFKCTCRTSAPTSSFEISLCQCQFLNSCTICRDLHHQVEQQQEARGGRAEHSRLRPGSSQQGPPELSQVRIIFYLRHLAQARLSIFTFTRVTYSCIGT